MLPKEMLNGGSIIVWKRNARKVTLSGTEISFLPADDLVYVVQIYVAE